MTRQDDRSRCAPPVKVGLAAKVDRLIREHANTVIPEPLFEGSADAAPQKPHESVTYRVYFNAASSGAAMVGDYSTWEGVIECLRLCKSLGREVRRIERTEVQVITAIMGIPKTA